MKISDREEFPLILTDLRMPEIDGIELCIQIKERNPETVIYAFSGHVTEDEFDQLEKMGGRYFNSLGRFSHYTFGVRFTIWFRVRICHLFS